VTVLTSLVLTPTQVLPEFVDDLLQNHTTKNFVLNYKCIIAMQLLEMGLGSMSDFLETTKSRDGSHIT